MKISTYWVGLGWVAIAALGCLHPASERASLDERAGRADADGVAVEVVAGLAAVRALDVSRLELWAQAPSLALTLSVPEPAAGFRIDVANCAPGTQGATRSTSVRMRHASAGGAGTSKEFWSCTLASLQ